MTTIDNDILLLERFINEEKEQLNEIVGIAALVKGIASVLSIPVVLQILATALQKVNELNIKFYLPRVQLDEVTLKSLLNQRGPESSVGTDDIKDSPESVKYIIEFINKYGMNAGRALNRYNEQEPLEFAKRSKEDQAKRNTRGEISANDPTYQLSLILNAIQQNMQLIIDEAFETVSSAVIESINTLTPVDLNLDRSYYSAVVKGLSKVILFAVVGASMFQTADTEGAKNVAEQGLGLFKKFKNGKKFYNFLNELEMFLAQVSAFIGDATAAAQLASITEFNLTVKAVIKIKEKIKEKKKIISEKFGDFDLLKFLVELEAKIADYFKEGNIRPPSFQDVLDDAKKTADAKARQAAQAGTDYHGSPVDYSSLVDNFLRQYIRMLLS